LENAIEQRRLGSPAIFFPSETESEFETKVKCELPTFAFVLCGQLVGWLVEIGTPGFGIGTGTQWPVINWRYYGSRLFKFLPVGVNPQKGI